MTALVWAILLLVLAITFIALEAFIPSAGMLTFFSLVSVIAAVVCAYRVGMSTGTIFMCVTAVLMPTVVALLVRWWPHTPLGKLILNQPASAEEATPESHLHETLLGAIGIATNRMLPSGAVKIEGRRFDAITEGMSIEKGTHVEVVGVRGNYIIVRPATSEAVFEAHSAKPDATSADANAISDLDDVIPDPFSDESHS